MFKTILFLFVCILIVLGIFIGSDQLKDFYINDKNPNTKSVSLVDENLNNDLNEVDSSSGISIKERVEIDNKTKITVLRNRKKLKGIISVGDVYFADNDLALALKNYLEAYKKSPNDEKIVKKVADTFYEMKQFAKSYDYYYFIKDITFRGDGYFVDRSRILNSLVYSTDFSNFSSGSYLKGIDELGLNEDDLFFYNTSILCTIDFHGCKTNFRKYYNENKDLDHEGILLVIKALDNYKASQIGEQYYKNVLVLGALFQSELYPIVIKLGEDILKERPLYKPVLQMIGKSYYELGDYKKSKKYIADYYRQEQSDEKTMYLLGLIHFKLKDYLISNIFIKKALDNGYTPTLDAKRMMIYNYFKLDDDSKILDSFRELIEEEGVLEPDYRLAIYYHILNEDLKHAEIIAKKAIEKYPKEDSFYSYLGWIYINNGNLDLAKENLDKSLKIDDSNPMTTYNMGRLFMEQGDKIKAKIYFTNTVKLDEKGEFGKMAGEEMERITPQ